MRGFWRIKSILGKLYATLSSKAIILAYHRVANLDTDPQLLAVNQVNFAKQLEIIRNYYTPTSLSDLVSALEQGRSVDNAVIVTFDDGYIDNFLYAKPLLEKYKIPATFFVSTHYINKKEEFWWDALEQLLLHPNALPKSYECTICPLPFTFKIESVVSSLLENQLGWDVTNKNIPGCNFDAYKKMHAHLKNLNYEQIQAHLRELENWAGTALHCRELYRGCSSIELIQLAQSPQATLGSHTIKHMRMSAISEEEQKVELLESKQHLQAIIQQPIDFFSYPFGGFKDFNPTSQSLVRKIYRGAVVNYEGLVFKNTSKFELPRFLVRDWTGDLFHSHLKQWFKRGLY